VVVGIDALQLDPTELDRHPVARCRQDLVGEVADLEHRHPVAGQRLDLPHHLLPSVAGQRDDVRAFAAVPVRHLLGAVVVQHDLERHRREARDLGAHPSESRLYARQSSPAKWRCRLTLGRRLRDVAVESWSSRMSTRMTRMPASRGSVGNESRPLPAKRQRAESVIASSTRLACTRLPSQPNSAELAKSIGISARGAWPASGVEAAPISSRPNAARPV
jgi:hypothetical protein